MAESRAAAAPLKGAGATTLPQGPTPLPVPELSATLQRYLLSIAPLVTTESFRSSTLKCVRFLQDSGSSDTITASKLQQLLQEKAVSCAERNKSWLIDDWVRLMYTTWRSPVPVNVSYWYLFSESTFRNADKKVAEQAPLNCVRAAALVLGAARFRDLIFSNQIPNEVMEGRVLDKNMYRYIFHSCRLPRPEQDGVRVYDGRAACAPSESIVVIRDGRLFLVSLNSAEKGQRASLTELAQRMNQVIKQASATPATQLTTITACHRDKWASVFSATFGDAAVKRVSHEPTVFADHALEHAELSSGIQALQALESSLCVVCLDSFSPRTLAEKSRNLLDGNLQNRWFDKVVQFVVCDNGVSGFIGEHAYCDGMPTANTLAWVCNKISRETEEVRVDNTWIRDLEALIPPRNRVMVSPQHPITPLTFNVPADSSVHGAIKEAKEEIDAQTDSHDLVAVNWASYGREAVKKCGVSPDAWAQMAIQLAYYRWKGKFVPTYEPAHARKFVWGRTACIRVVSEPSCAWVSAMSVKDRASRNPAHVLRLLKSASDTHATTSRMAAAGMDVDRHLLGLRILYNDIKAKSAPSLRCSAAVDEFFADESLRASSTWYISTSNLSVEHFENWGWGEVVHGGIGVAYGVHANHMTFNVVAEKIMGVSGFAEHLKLALQEMYTLAVAAKTT